MLLFVYELVFFKIPTSQRRMNSLLLWNNEPCRPDAAAQLDVWASASRHSSLVQTANRTREKAQNQKPGHGATRSKCQHVSRGKQERKEQKAKERKTGNQGGYPQEGKMAAQEQESDGEPLWTVTAAGKHTRAGARTKDP